MTKQMILDGTCHHVDGRIASLQLRSLGDCDDTSSE